MSRNSFLTVVRARHLDEDSERGSLPMAMLVMLVGVILTAAMAPMAINQHRATTFDQTRVHSLDAAQAGIDVMVGKIRTATGSLGADPANGIPGGDPSQLPCTNANDQSPLPLVGKVGGVGSESYSVTIQYFVTDPVAHVATPMTCVAGHGPYDSASSTVVPSYAKIVSIGTDGVDPTAKSGGSLGRTITSVYGFEVDNRNIGGGIIRVFAAAGDGAAEYCFDAGAGTPTAGVTTISLQPCSTTYPPAPQQTFAYNSDLTLQLVSTVGTTVNGVTYSTGLCLDISNISSGTTPAANSPLVLKQCGNSDGTIVWSQQWAFDGYAAFHAPVSTSISTGNLSTQCIAVPVSGTPAVHSAGAITLKTCDGTFPTPTNTWVASPATGAGAATNSASMQFINFQQFGECIHDPRADTAAPYLIAGSCLQNPKLSAIGTNQKLTFAGLFGDGTTQLYYSYSGTNYCLYSQQPIATDTNVLDHRILLVPCTSGSVARTKMSWTRSTPATDPSKPYSQQYRFQDSVGSCMSLATITSGMMPGGDKYLGAYDYWKKLITTTCDSSTLQQWNATKNGSPAALQNTREN